MKNSPLCLEKAFFTKVLIEAQRDGTPGCTYEVDAVPQLHIRDDKRKWANSLRVLLRPHPGQKPNYTVEVEMVAFFSVEESWPEEKIEQLVHINGSSVLFSAVREMVCNLTSRGPWPMVMLPTLSFNDSFDGKKAKLVAKKPKV